MHDILLRITREKEKRRTWPAERAGRFHHGRFALRPGQTAPNPVVSTLRISGRSTSSISGTRDARRSVRALVSLPERRPAGRRKAKKDAHDQAEDQRTGDRRRPGLTVLEAARRTASRSQPLRGKGLSSYGGCRLCLVEIKGGEVCPGLLHAVEDNLE